MDVIRQEKSIQRKSTTIKVDAIGTFLTTSVPNEAKLKKNYWIANTSIFRSNYAISRASD